MGLKKPLRTDNGSATLVFRVFSTVHSDIEDAVPENEVDRYAIMICQRLSELYSAFLDDAVSGEERAAIEQHLRSCLACRRMAAEVRCIRDEVSSLNRRPDRSVDIGSLSAQI